jgi:hypothetical protein
MLTRAAFFYVAVARMTSEWDFEPLMGEVEDDSPGLYAVIRPGRNFQCPHSVFFDACRGHALESSDL